VVPLLGAESARSLQASDDAASATSSEESFELVGTADVAEFDSAGTEAKPALADPVSDPADEESAALDPAIDDVKASSSEDVPCQ